MILTWYAFDTHLIRIWYSCDTHMILIWYSLYSSDTHLIRMWYAFDTHDWYSFDTHVILMWYSWYSFEYQMSIRHLILIWYAWYSCDTHDTWTEYQAQSDTQRYSWYSLILTDTHRAVCWWRRVRRTETYPILETFLFLFTTQRFGGVGALEGREKVPDHIFLEIKKTFVFLAECYGINRIFLQNCVSGGRLWMDDRIFLQNLWKRGT